MVAESIPVSCRKKSTGLAADARIGTTGRRRDSGIGRPGIGRIIVASGLGCESTFAMSFEMGWRHLSEVLCDGIVVLPKARCSVCFGLVSKPPLVTARFTPER